MPGDSNPSHDVLRERLAAIEHQRWADWQEYMFQCAVTSGTDDGIGYRVLGWPKEQYDNWQRQIETPYAELSEKEKDSDREQVDRYISLIDAHTEEKVREKLQSIVDTAPEDPKTLDDKYYFDIGIAVIKALTNKGKGDNDE